MMPFACLTSERQIPDGSNLDGIKADEKADLNKSVLLVFHCLYKTESYS